MMRFVRCREGSSNVYGLVEGETVELLDEPPHRGVHRSGARRALDTLRLLAPVEPTKIIGVGRNYMAHAAEHRAPVPAEPLLFLKPPSAVIGPGEVIQLPPQSAQVEHEGELALVIGQRCRHVAEAEVARCLLGYTAANDVTARDLQRSDPQWTRGKGFDTFCPLGPWIETELELAQARIVCKVNGELRQQGRAGEMVFPVEKLVAYISQVMTLEAGDVILSGTPAGVGPLSDGDEVVVVIDGIGALSNPVRG